MLEIDSEMKKLGFVLLVIMMILGIMAMTEVKHCIKVKGEWVKRKTTVDPSSLKVYVDNEDKCLYLDIRENFAPLTVEIKNTKNQIVFRSVVYPTAIGEYTLSLGNIPLGQYELNMYNSEVRVQGSFNL